MVDGNDSAFVNNMHIWTIIQSLFHRKALYDMIALKTL